MERPDIVPYLAGEASRGRLIIFVGAGCSVWAGLPTWRELLDRIFASHRIPTRLTDPVKLGGLLETRLGNLPFREEITRRLTLGPKASTELHDALARLPINLYVTTNYDHLLEQSFTKAGYPYRVIQRDLDVPSLDRTQKTIVKLHGDIDSPSSLVITPADYTAYPASHAGLSDWLRARFSEDTILFVGTSFDDPNLRDADDQVLSTFGNFRRPPVLIVKKPQRLSTEPPEEYEIALSDFEALCKGFEQRNFRLVIIEDYQEILEILGSLNNALAPPMASMRADGMVPMVSDAVEKLSAHLSELLDARTKELIAEAKGRDYLLTPSFAWERAQELREHLENPKHRLRSESYLEGFLVLANTALRCETPELLTEAKRFQEKALSHLPQVQDRTHWEERLRRLKAKILFAEGKIEDALPEVSSSEDPLTQAAWLAILNDADRAQEAKSFLEATPWNAEWVATAVSLWVKLGDLSKAEILYNEANANLSDSPQELDRLQCVYASALYLRVLRVAGIGAGKRPVPRLLPQEAQDLCRRILRLTEGVRSRNKHCQVSQAEWFSKALWLEMMACRLLGEWNQVKNNAMELLACQPLSPQAARLLTDKAAVLSKEEQERLLGRLEQENAAWAHLTRAGLLCFHFGKPAEAWEAIEKACSLAGTRDDVEELLQTAFAVAVGLKQPERGVELAREILDPDDRLLTLLEAQYSIIQGDNGKAETLLKDLLESDQTPPNLRPFALRAIGHLEFSRGKHKEARKNFEEALDLNYYATPLIYKDLIKALAELKDIASLYQRCKEMQSLGIEDEVSRHLLAQASYYLGHIEESLELWKNLHNEREDIPEYAMGLAQVLHRLERTDEALRILSKEYEPSLPILHTTAYILHDADKEEDLFDLLNGQFDLIRNDPQLLLLLINACYRTGHDEEANRVMGELIRLREEGKVSEDMFRPVTPEEFIETLKERKEFEQQALERYRKGRLPRILLARMNNTPMYLDWSRRTQEITIRLDRSDWPDYTIYCTDGIEPIWKRGKGPRYAEISVPTKTDAVVVDYHALITLNELDLLPLVALCFRKILVPETYRKLWKEEIRSYRFHHLSREKAWRKILEQVDLRNIRIAQAPEGGGGFSPQEKLSLNLSLCRLEKCPYLDNYTPADQFAGSPDIRVIRLGQLTDWLFETGRISEETREKIGPALRGEQTIYDGNIGELFRESVQVVPDEMTIEIIFELGIYDAMKAAGIRLLLEQSTIDSFRRAVLELSFGEETRKKHESLSTHIEKNSQVFNFAPADKPHTRLHGSEETKQLAYAAIHLAERFKTALLTDDRFATTYMRAKEQKRPVVRFDTAALLKELHRRGLISLAEYANKFLQLCKWRYRFLVPEPEVLLQLAMQFKRQLPGEGLEFLFRYALDCMQDPGINLEIMQDWSGVPIDPPMPTAVRLWLVWNRKIISFLCKAWQEESLSEEEKTRLTDWALYQFVPPPPMDLREDIRRNLSRENAAFNFRLVLSEAVLVAKNPKNLHVLLKILKKDLENHGHNAQVAMMQYLKGLWSDNSVNQETFGRLWKRAFRAFFGGGDAELRDAAVPMAAELDIISGDYDPKKATPTLTDAKIRNQLPPIEPEETGNIEYRGPVAIILPEGEGVSGKVRFSHEEVLNPDARERKKALDLLLSDDKDSWITEPTREIATTSQTNLLSSTFSEWTKAGQTIREALLSDSRYTRNALSLALEYSLWDVVNGKDGQKGFLERALRPSAETAWAERPLLLRFRESSKSLMEDLQKRLSSIGQEDLHGILNCYLDEVGFVPLGQPLDPWSVLKKYLLPEKNTFSKLADGLMKWIEENSLVENYLAVLPIILSLRAGAPDGTDKDFFADDQFCDRLSDLLGILFGFAGSRQNKTEDEGDKPCDLSLTHRWWCFQIATAQHYLYHLELSESGVVQREDIPLLSWYLARQFCKTVLLWLKKLNPEYQIERLEKATGKLEKENAGLCLRHLLADHSPAWNASKYLTVLHPALLPGTSALAILSPTYYTSADRVAPWIGLREPSRIVDDDLRYSMQNAILKAALNGLGGVGNEVVAEADILWTIPAVKSGMEFLRSYYGGSIEYLGEEELQNLKMAESTSNPSFLAEHLAAVPQYVTDKDKSDIVAILLKVLQATFWTQKNEPLQVSVIAKNAHFIDHLLKLPEGWLPFCLTPLTEILFRALSSGRHELANGLSRQFKNLNLANFNDKVACSLTSDLLTCAVIGGDVSLVQIPKKASRVNKAIREKLGVFKGILTEIIKDVPPDQREKVNMIMMELRDVPLLVRGANT